MKKYIQFSPVINTRNSVLTLFLTKQIFINVIIIFQLQLQVAFDVSSRIHEGRREAEWDITFLRFLKTSFPKGSAHRWN